jgi:NADP-dependent 3-hydroxy acid dehydrogenase YdfG
MSDVEFALPQYTQNHHTEPYPSISPNRPELSTRGKTVVITGAGTGVGAASAFAYAQSGCFALILIGRTETTLLSTKESVEKAYPGTKVYVCVVDLTDAPAIYGALKSISTATNSKFDILVANASYLPDLTPVLESSADDWWKGFEINVKGQYNLIRAFIAVAVKDAILINVSSAVAHLPFAPKHGAYHASKIAAIKLFDYIRMENPDLVVMHFHPGVIETEMARKSYAAGTPKMLASNGKCISTIKHSSPSRILNGIDYSTDS